MKHDSHYLSYLLRHKPEQEGLTLEDDGWCSIEALASVFSKDALEQIVGTDPKHRFAISEDGTKIRAVYGHSVPIRWTQPPSIPPTVLYHGTAERYKETIEQKGLLPQSRLFVHLTTEIDTAITVGKRHGVPLLYAVDCKSLIKKGQLFYKATDSLWLTKAIPPEFLTPIYKEENI